MKNLKNNLGEGPVSAQKGITLIALVITVIVMLILIAVTISMAVNGGLFDYAKKATEEMQNAIDIEQQLADGRIQIGGVWYESIDHYLTGNLHNWTRSGDTFTCSHCDAEYTMGEVVNYEREKAGEAVTAELTAEKSGLDRLYEKEGSYPEFAIVDANGNQTIEAQDTNWVVLGIEDTNGDNIYETLLITTETDLWVKDEEENWYGIYFYGAAEYNNGVDEINRICKELYSNSEYGFARGMTIEDVNVALNYTPIGGRIINNSSYKTTGNLTTKLKNLPEEIWNAIRTNENGTNTPSGINTEEVLGNYELNGYSYFVMNENSLSLMDGTEDRTSEITEIERNTIFGPYIEDWGSYEYCYWLASRGVAVYSVWNNSVQKNSYALFGLGFVEIGDAYSYGGDFRSGGGENFYNAGLRPVVSLISKLPTTVE